MYNLLCHTASLYPLYADVYENTLEDRIEQCINAGCDGVEISNGPLGLLQWNPSDKIRKLLRGKIITIHAELDNNNGINLSRLGKKLFELDLDIKNVTFHPDELSPNDWFNILKFPLHLSVENMDKNKNNYRTYQEIKSIKLPEIGFTFDTAHSMEHGFNDDEFMELFIPDEVHLSVSTNENKHTLTHRAIEFPFIPIGTKLIVIEGIVSNNHELIDEINYIKSKLTW